MPLKTKKPTSTRKPKVSKTTTAVAASAVATSAVATSAVATSAVAAPVAATPPVTEPTSQENTVVTDDVTTSQMFSSLLGDINWMSSRLSALKTQFKLLEKRTTRELKQAQKHSNKKRNTNRLPSGFVKPTLISDQMANFLQKPIGTEMARTEVTRALNQYIRSNSLQDAKNGRIILPDAPLRKLLAVPKADELTYFNLQRYMSPHFAKVGLNKTSAELGVSH